jgi:hypothetical protein
MRSGLVGSVDSSLNVQRSGAMPEYRSTGYCYPDHRSVYFTGIGLDRVTGTAVTLFCGLPSMILSEYVR